MRRAPTRNPAAPATDLCLRLLGAASWSRAGLPAVPLERRDAGVLVYLALEGESPRARLLALLWPDAESEVARNHLRQRLFRLKKACGTDLIRGTEMLSIAAGVVVDALDPCGVTQADELLQGLDFSDCPTFFAWLGQQRAQRRSTRNDALAQRASDLEREGKIAEALVQAEQLVALEPLLEHAHRRVMRLHYLRGDRAAAIAAFEHCERVFKRELGARPGSETIALLQTVESARAVTTAPARNVIPAAILRPPRMIGRERDLAALDDAWQRDAIFCVLGEAGVGKTRLLSEFAAMQARPVLVQARPGDAAVPYAALARLLRALGDPRRTPLDERARNALALVLPELAATGSASAASVAVDASALQRAAEDVLVDARTRDIRGLIVDDLHFADAASVETLGRLFGAERLAGFRFGFAQRPAESADAGALLRDSLLDLGRLHEMRLLPLGESELAQLVDSLAIEGLSGARLAPVLHRHTGGNPMYVLETLKSLVVEGAPLIGTERLPLPTTVAGLIERRLRHLSAPALALARVAAIAGSDFTVELAAQVLQQRAVDLADPWAELEAAQILRGQAFAHDLICEATLATVPGPVARQLHGEVAAWLEQRAGQFARIAEHWQAAGRQQSAGHYWQRAAAAAKASSRHGERAMFLEQAVTAFRLAEDRACEIDCLAELIAALVYVDIGARLSAAIERALALAAAPEQRLRVLSAAAYAEQNCGRYEHCVVLSREALQLSVDLKQPAAGFYAARNLATSLTAIGRAHEALATFEQHRGWVEVHGSAENRCEFASDRSWPLLALGRLAEARDSFEQARAIALELDNAADLNAVLNLIAGTEARMGMCRAALARSEQAIRLHDRLGAVTATSINDYLMYGLLCARLGRYSDALRHLGDALSRFEAVGATRYADSTRYVLAATFVELGQFARAQRIAAPLRVVDASKAAPRQWSVEALLAEAAGANPREHYQRLIALLGDHSGSTAYNTREVALLQSARWGDTAAAGSALDALAIAAEQHQQLGLLIAVLTRRAQVDRARVQQAAVDVRRALALLNEYEPEGIYRAEIWAVATRVLGAAGAVDEARAALRDGASWIETTAREHVPEEFRDSFLNRNPVNRELLRAASRARLQAG